MRRGLRALSQISKGTLVTAGVTFISKAISFLEEEKIKLALMLGALGLGCVIFFVIWIERQAEDRAFERLKNLQKQT